MTTRADGRVRSTVRREVTRTVLPLVMPQFQKAGAQKVQRLYGFWLVYHLSDGWRALIAAGWGESAVHRQRRDFRAVFGCDVEDAWPGLAAACVEGKASRKAAAKK